MKALQRVFIYANHNFHLLNRLTVTEDGFRNAYGFKIGIDKQVLMEFLSHYGMVSVEESVQVLW